MRSSQPMLRVVVVDDEPAVARSLGRLLATQGFEVLTCESGAAALALLSEAPVDAVVSDFNMPGMNGVALLAEVKRRWPRARRVMVSALAETLDAASLADCQPCTVLPKPFDERALVAALKAEDS